MYLAHISVADLHDVLDNVEGKTATRRVLAGISYKDGVDQQTIASRHNVHRNTVRNWLQRLDELPEAPPEAVVYDSPHPGRPRALDSAEFTRFVDAISESLSTEASEANAQWTAEEARTFIEATFGVAYSLRHASRLLATAERKARGQSPDSDA